MKYEILEQISELQVTNKFCHTTATYYIIVNVVGTEK